MRIGQWLYRQTLSAETVYVHNFLWGYAIFWLPKPLLGVIPHSTILQWIAFAGANKCDNVLQEKIIKLQFLRMYKLIEKKPAVILLVFQSPEEGLGL